MIMLRCQPSCVWHALWTLLGPCRSLCQVWLDAGSVGHVCILTTKSIVAFKLKLVSPQQRDRRGKLIHAKMQNAHLTTLQGISKISFVVLASLPYSREEEEASSQLAAAPLCTCRERIANGSQVWHSVKRSLRCILALWLCHCRLERSDANSCNLDSA